MIQAIILAGAIAIFIMVGIPVIHKSILDNKLEYLRELNEMDLYD